MYRKYQLPNGLTCVTDDERRTVTNKEEKTTITYTKIPNDIEVKTISRTWDIVTNGELSDRGRETTTIFTKGENMVEVFDGGFDFNHPWCQQPKVRQYLPSVGIEETFYNIQDAYERAKELVLAEHTRQTID